MPVWELALYVVLGAAALFALSVLIPPRSDWQYRAVGFAPCAAAVLIMMS